MMNTKTRAFPIFSSLAAMAITTTGLAADSSPEHAENMTSDRAYYDPGTQMLHLPAVDVPSLGHVMVLEGEMKLVPDPDALLFHVTSLETLHSIHWGYEGADGPEFWGTLTPSYALCADGQNQSPINITETISADVSNIVFNYQPTALNILNNGHTIQVNYDEGSSIEVDGTTYQLLQFHFHTLSEHTLNGKHTAMEMHLVHKSDEGHLAVVGVMMDQGSENASLAPIWAHLPAEAGEEQHIDDVTIDATDLLPTERLSYQYSGSLTTPPCSEGVKWMVLTTPQQVSEAQVAAVESIIGHNYRPVQPLSARQVLKDSD